MEFDIYIYPEKSGKASGIRIPWLPSEIECDFGDIRVASYEILDQGPIDIPTGSNLGRFSWSSIFPGEMHDDLPFLKGDWQDPGIYRTKLNEWKRKGTDLKVIITGTKINHKVRCEKFTYRYTGGHGDISYDLTLKVRRYAQITTVKPTTNKPKNKPKKDTTKAPTTYTIKSGDTLWGIATKYLKSGTKWKEIYNLNKSIIESTAKKYGKKSSDGGHWIYPGCKIKIPK